MRVAKFVQPDAWQRRPLGKPLEGEVVGSDRRTVFRAFLARLGVGGRQPVGALARVEGVTYLRIDGMLALDGGGILRGTHRGTATDPWSIGKALADELIGRASRTRRPN